MCWSNIFCYWRPQAIGFVFLLNIPNNKARPCTKCPKCLHLLHFKNQRETHVKLRKLLTFLLLLCTALAAGAPTDTLHRTDTLHADTLFVRWLADNQLPVYPENRVTLLKSGQEKFDDLFQHIRQARHHIHLEYFNFRNDSIGNALFALLAEKAAEGVTVRAMFDAFGNLSNDRPLGKSQISELRRQGIELVKFDPFAFPYLNHAFHRDHRKIVVIDGTVGYLGGMNIADYYIHGLPSLGAWRDMHMRIEGDAVAALQHIFLDMWNRETKQNIDGQEYFPAPQEAQTNTAVPIAIVDRTPGRTGRAIKHAYIEALRSARREVCIITPYFVPVPALRRELNRTLKRGVRVRIMVSSKSDIPFTPGAALYKLHRLMRRGAEVYLYNGGFHHTKTMTIDHRYCTIGTANLNSRSMLYDYETNAFLFSPCLTERMDSLFRSDTRNSTRLTPEVWKQRSVWKKFTGWFAHLFTPFL